MKIRFSKRTIFIYIAVILVFLAIQFIEPYPIGTEDYEVYNFAQWIVWPLIAAFVMTIIFCVAVKGTAEEKLPVIIWTILTATLAYIVSDFSFGIGYSFLFALILCGFPSTIAFLLYLVGHALFDVLNESRVEAMKKWEENNTNGF